jgi:outer membrane lipoprotein carrier protein
VKTVWPFLFLARIRHFSTRLPSPRLPSRRAAFLNGKAAPAFPDRRSSYGKIALAIFILTTLPLAAQSIAPSAAQLAAAVDHHYNTLHRLRVDFTESYAGLGMDRHESGVLLLEKPGRMRWNYAAPPGKVFVLDGKFGWFYTPGDAQVQQIPAKKLDDLRSPLRFLLGHAQLTKELTGLTMAPAENGEFRLRGVPKGMEQRVRSLEVVASADGTIHAMTLEELDGSRTSFAFRNEQANPVLAPDTFRFEAPAGVPVVEGTPPV